MSILIAILFSVAAFATLVRLYVKRDWKLFTEEVDLQGKTVIVTGANAGIGESLAVEFARRNARVILACRSIIRGEGARQHVLSMAERTNGVIFKRLDLSSLESVRKFAEDVIKTEPRLDILVNNAAITGQSVKATRDGLDLTYQTNHFGPFLLTNLLLDLLKKSGPGTRIVNVGSMSHTQANLDLNYLKPEKLKEYISFKQEGSIKKKAELLLYQNTKLMNVMFTYELARRLGNGHLTVNCVHPGIVSTNMLKERRLIIMLLRVFMEVVAKPPYYGCQPILYCALSPTLRDVTGKYFGNLEEDLNVNKMAYNQEECKKLWKISEEFVGLSDSLNASA